AIVIPDPGRSIGLVVPALAFEDIILTHDPKELEKIKKATNNNRIKPVTLLGASTWNNPQTLESCGKDCDQAVFVDAYYIDDPDPKVRDFVTAYHTATGIDPNDPKARTAPGLWEAQAYDGAGLLRWLITTEHPADREMMRDKLGAVPTYEG